MFTPQETPAPESSIALMLSAHRKVSFFKMTPCQVIFLEDQIVFAYLSQTLRKAESAKMSKQIKEEKLGFFKGSVAMIKFWSYYSQKYLTMPIDEILAEDPLNMALQNDKIEKVLFRCCSNSYAGSDNAPTTNQGKLHFTLRGGEKMKFTHSQRHDASVRSILEKLFGSKLKYRKR